MSSKALIMRTASWLGAAAVLLLPGLADAQGTLTGTVIAEGSGRALAGAQISLSGLNLGASAGPNGEYTVSDIPAGTHTVQVTLIGHRAQSQDVTIVDGETARLDFVMAESAIELEGLVAVGSRAQPRTVTESPVPVDVISTPEFINQGDTDLSNLLRNVVPSYNVNTQPISDAATFARPANLRGLAPDHSLVLVNGKRRHRTAVVTWYGNGLADGSQGPDIALIPGLALRQAEVLRDGAAAQYGSDAIAGVLNFVLRDDRSGGSIEVKGGGNLLEGDGEMYTVSGNVGLPLGDDGFLNLTGEYGNTWPTDRSIQRDDALALIGDGNTHVRQPAQIWGSPRIDNEIKLWANSGYDFTDQVQVYTHGNVVKKTVEGGFYYRNPNTRSGVFATTNADGEDILLVGDMLDAQDGVLDGTANCPEVRVVNGLVADKDAWNQVLGNPNCFTFQKMFPGGFTPQFGANVLDASAVAGVRGAGDRLSWDASVAWGKSNMDFFMYNTVNASLGPDQPCSDEGTSPHVPDQPCTPFFNPGIYDQQETNLNLDVSYALTERLNLAGGAEWRNERFEIIPGDEASWVEGPLAFQGFTPGSNGFTGFGPLTEGNWNRSNFAAYADTELRGLEGAWTVGVAGRIERFSDFGTTVNGKVAGRVSLTDALALRASASTGFRAPTPGQQNAFNISTIYDPEIMDLTNNGTIPSTSELAKLYGGQPLEPETSFNLAAGLVVQSGAFSMSADAFQISVSDRLTTSRNYSLSPADVERLLREGIIRPGGVLARFRFFINDFATRTRGIDLVSTYRMQRSNGTTELSAMWNYTTTAVTEHNPETLTDSRIRILQEGLPNLRGSLTASHTFANGFRFLVRGSHWGGYYDGEQPYYTSSPSETIDYPARQLIDVEAAYSVNDNWRIVLGGQNALNTFPEQYPGAAAGVGNTYGQFTPFGFNGAFYYSRLAYSW